MPTTHNIIRTTTLAGALLLASVPVQTAAVLAEPSVEVRPDAISAPQQTPRFPYAIMKEVRKSLKTDPESTEADNLIDTMSKTEVMDRFIATTRAKLRGSHLRSLIDGIFGIRLDLISSQGEGTQLTAYPAEIAAGVRASLAQASDPDAVAADLMSMPKIDVMDYYVQSLSEPPTGAEVRQFVNRIFGVNLDGIAALERARISLYSKGQWITRTDADLIAIRTGKGDIDVNVQPTAYYKATIGSDKLPAELEQSLQSLGFTFLPDTNAYYYAEPSALSVPDSFKGKVIGAIVSFTRERRAEAI